MENLTNQEQLLIQYLDGQLSEEERQLIEKKISESDDLKKRLQELQMVDSLLRKSQVLDVPSKNFTAKVLQNLYNYNPNQLRVSKNGIFLLIGIIVAVGLASFLLSFGGYDFLNGNLALQSFNSNKTFVKLPTFAFPGKLIINIILIATTAVSFIVLDRTVLRPIFARRAEMIR